MRKSYFWSLLAAAAMMTACSEDALETQGQAPELTGPETPVSFSVNVGNGIGTYATESDKGGWTNWKTETEGMGKAFNARAIIQVFAQSGTDAKPLAEIRKVVSPAELTGNTIAMNGLRLPAGNTYTAVTWVDFVPVGTTTSTTADRKDYFYQTENLATVKMLDPTNSAYPLNKFTSLTGVTPEARDAYAGRITFTVNKDGGYTMINGVDQTSPSSTVLDIQAKRPLAKVRLVFKDWDNKAQWKQYFAGQLGTRAIDLVTLTAGGGGANAGMAVGYNALTGKPVASTVANEVYTFYRSFAQGTELDNAVNNVKWYSEGGKDYPVFDFNYFIPASNEQTATYKMGVRTYAMNGASFSETVFNGTMFDGGTTWKHISERNFDMIPVRTNYLTTIKGNFLTKGYNFTVTVADFFEVKTEEVTVPDNTPQVSVDTYFIPTPKPGESTVGRAKIEIMRDANRMARGIKVSDASTQKIDGVSVIDAVLVDLAGIVNADGAYVQINTTGFNKTASFKGINVAGIQTNLDGVLAQDTEIKDLTSDFNLVNKADQTNKITITAGDVEVYVIGTKKYADVVVKSEECVHFGETGSLFTGTVVANAERIYLEEGAYSKAVTLNKNNEAGEVLISDGSYDMTVTSYSNTSIEGGQSTITSTPTSVDAFLMNSQSKKTVMLSNVVFGKVNAYQISSTNSSLRHVLDFDNDANLYRSYSNGNNGLGNNWNIINYQDITY